MLKILWYGPSISRTQSKLLLPSSRESCAMSGPTRWAGRMNPSVVPVNQGAVSDHPPQVKLVKAIFQ
jgi:hypothetical protein